MPATRKMPFRSDNRITQPFNDGIVRICRVVDVAEPGYKPVEKLEPLAALRYENQRVGVQRYFSAMQNQVKVDRVIRVPKGAVRITNQEIAVTEDGDEYRVDLVQDVPGVFPPCADLTLTRIDQGETYEMV